MKSAYFLKKRKQWFANVQRCKTNRRIYRLEPYKMGDFDVALIWHPGEEVFFVIPIADFLKWKSAHLTLSSTSQSRTKRFREAWHLV